MAAKTMVFKYYTEKEIEKLLSTKNSKKIIKVKVKRWLDTKKLEYFYGLDVFDKTGKVFCLCEGNRAVVFEDKKTAALVCKVMNLQIIPTPYN